MENRPGKVRCLCRGALYPLLSGTAGRGGQMFASSRRLSAPPASPCSARISCPPGINYSSPYCSGGETRVEQEQPITICMRATVCCAECCQLLVCDHETRQEILVHSDQACHFPRRRSGLHPLQRRHDPGASLRRSPPDASQNTRLLIVIIPDFSVQ